MNEQDVRALIQQEIHKTSQSGRFNVTNTQRHIHNNIDSPYAFQPILTFVGSIGSDGTIFLLPKGWSASHDDVGQYSIVHNLGTRQYSVVTSALQSTNVVAVPVIQPLLDNSFSINWFNTSPTIKDTAFNFLLTNVNNKSQKIPTYYGVLTE